jgi:hypothetical protein
LLPEAERQFLFVSSQIPDAALSMLKTSGIYYRHKRLDSTAANWMSIVQIIKDERTSGCVIKLTAAAYRLLVLSEYSIVVPLLLDAIRKKPHLLLAHEGVINGASETEEEPPTPDDDLYDESRYDYMRAVGILAPPDDATRATVNNLLASYELRVLPYRTNAELAVMASSFIEDTEKSLLFRVYVPSGRLYAVEADKLLDLFRDYLHRVGHKGVRQDGYSTAAGHVYEFFGAGTRPGSSITQQFDEFSRFLDQCIENPTGAVTELAGLGVDHLQAPLIVQRYGREGKRIQKDIRQQRETRILTLKHQLEDELEDLAEGADMHCQLATLVDNLTPRSPGSVLAPSAVPLAGDRAVNLTINQQIVNAAQGAVIHNVQGTAHFDPEAKQLLELIGQYGGTATSELETAVHELEDPDARSSDRVTAKQQIKGFLFKVASRLDGPVLDVLQKYVESKLGL